MTQIFMVSKGDWWVVVTPQWAMEFRWKLEAESYLIDTLALMQRQDDPEAWWLNTFS